MLQIGKCVVGSLLIVNMSIAWSDDIEIVGKIDYPIQQTNKMYGTLPLKEQKHISLLKLQLSDAAQEQLEHNLQTTNLYSSVQDLNASSSIQLGMNKVPVLDQGAHGSCVTFAVTGAVDAALGYGDYISQLCQLNLGNYLEKYSYGSSGWNGSLGLSVASQMSLFGIVNKDKQRANACGVLSEYPTRGQDGSDELSIEQFSKISEPVFENSIVWSVLLDANQRTTSEDAANVLQKIKLSLQNGSRVSIGMILLALDQGIVGATGTHHVQNDTWVLTPKIILSSLDPNNIGGHEMIITGYDDNAVAVDADKKIHKGLFTVRNSWGSDVGDHGDFYISYNYIQALLIEAIQIRRAY